MAEHGIKTTENVKAVDGFQSIEETPTMNAGSPNLYDLVTNLIFYQQQLTWAEEDENSTIDKMAVMQEIEKIEEIIARKFDDAVFAIRDLESRANALKKIQDDIAKKRTSVVNQMERLANYLLYVGQIDPENLKGAIYKGHIISKPSVDDEYDAAKLPSGYLVEKISHRLDKKKILAKFKEGEKVPGTNVLIKEHLRIS